MSPEAVYTVGHSTRALDEFLALLTAHGIKQLIDIRSIPGSRRHPHFSASALATSLGEAGIAYRHSPELGGRRTPRPDSANTIWRVAGFRGYADYMETAAFQTALDELVKAANATAIVIMCAEAVWWRCHRQLVADALVARGIVVRHIASPSSAPLHTLTDFAHAEGGRVSYRRLI
jgi:uncharacterized protein (DUF488 family)